MSVPRLVLHVGMPRTATTSVQQSLVALQPQLRRRRIGYISHSTLVSGPSRAGWMNRVGAEASRRGDFNAELRELVRKEFSACRRATGRTARTLFISSEALLGARVPGPVDFPIFRPYAEQAISQVVEAVDPDRVELILTVRRQDRLMESSHVWELQKGRHFKLSTQFPYWPQPQLSYTALLSRLGALPRVADVHVRPFELISGGLLGFLADIIQPLGLRRALDLSAVPKSATTRNRSYSQPAVSLAREINRHLETPQQRAAAKDFLLTTFPSPPYPPATILLPQRRERILRAYAEDNRALFQRWMPHLPADSYATEADTKAMASGLAGEGHGSAPDPGPPAGVPA